MSVYTKTGDTGETAIFGGGRVSKAHPQVNAYGSLDELTSYIGLVITKLQNKEDSDLLITVQRNLYEMMAILAGADKTIKNLEKEIVLFEKEIDILDKKLPKLSRFILPGGTEMAGWLHVVRTITRRSERQIVDFFATDQSTTTIGKQSQKIMVKYLNRLSDLFFMMARKYDEGKEIQT